MKLLIDMNLSPRWVDWFAAEGISASHWSRIGRSDAIDTEIMQHAKSNDFVVLTHDLDFGAILAATHGAKPSVVQIRADDTRPEIIGVAVVAGLTQLEAELQAGALVTIEPARQRVRLLPL